MTEPASPQEVGASSDSAWLAGGARPEIVTVGDPRLRAPVGLVEDVAGVSDRIDGLVTLLRELKGAGLAAPQVGWSVAAAVVEVRKTEAFPDRPESPLIVLLNPRIVEASSADVVEDWEGCFSVPGLMGRVPRPSSVTVVFMARDGEEREETFSGYLGRVVQHEIDHLEGRIFLDRMTSTVSLSTIENWQRFGRASSQSR